MGPFYCPADQKVSPASNGGCGLKLIAVQPPELDMAGFTRQ